MPELHSLLLVVVACVITAALRFFPFLVFGGKRKTPEVVLYLGRVLPYAVMGMLVVYCLRATTFTALDGWLPTLLGVIAVAVLHILWRSTLLSIIGGTVIYMLLINFVF